MTFRLLAGMALLVVFLAPLDLSAQESSRSSTHIYIGILDDARIEVANWKPGVAPDRIVRPAFEKTAGGWEPVNPTAFPNRMSWTVAFDGRSIGSIASRTIAAGEVSGSRTM